MTLRRAWSPCVLALLAACSHPPQGADWVPPGPFVDVRLAATDLWSGGEVTVISSSFKAMAALPTVQVGGAAGTVRRVDDSTIAAQLSDTDGVFALHVSADSFQAFDATITVHGFQQIRSGPLMSGGVQAIPGQPLILGAGDVGLVELNLRTNAVTRTWPDTVHARGCIQGVGPSVRPGHYVFFGKDLSGTCTHPYVWQYGAPMVRKDSIPGRAASDWTIAEVGPGGSLRGAGQNLFISHCLAGVCTEFSYINAAANLYGVVMGTVARRAVLLNLRGSPVVDAMTGDTLYSLPFAHATRVGGAVFSPAEDTLYVVGDTSGIGGNNPKPALVMVGAATGIVYRTASFSGGYAVGIGQDALRPWLYVITQTPFASPQLVVLDRRSLATIATLRAPASLMISRSGPALSFAVVPDPGGTKLFVVVTPQDQSSLTGVAPVRILTFGLPVPTGVAP